LEESRLFDLNQIESELGKTMPAIRRSRPKSSVDEAREFSGWTIHKLEVLRVYLTQYRKVAGNGSYLDGFAGQGRITVDGVERPGSAAIALQSGAFKTLRFYEKQRKAAQLDRWLDSFAASNQRRRCQVVPGDCNKKIVEDLHEELVPRAKPCLAVLDPDSTQLNWSTVVALANYKADCTPPKTCKIELWILLNSYQVLMRLMPHDGPPNARVLNRWLGGETGWRDLYERGEGPGMYAYRYCQRLVSELGYGLAVPLLIRDPKTRRPQYHMIHASDHRAAHEFMRWAGNHAAISDVSAPSLPNL
jgi:three-Cys-motif partner protein